MSTQGDQGPVLVVIYAIPLSASTDRILFYPVVHGLPVESRGRIDRWNNWLRTKWHAWGQSPPNTCKAKTYRFGSRTYFDKESAVTKFLKRMPPGKHYKIEIRYPSTLTQGEVLGRLEQEANKATWTKGCSAAGFAVLLPVAVVIDVLTIGFVLTLTDVLATVFATRQWLTAKHVHKLVADPTTRTQMQTTPDIILGQFHSGLQHAPSNQQIVPTDADIDHLCVQLGHVEIAKTIKKVRNHENKQAKK